MQVEDEQLMLAAKAGRLEALEELVKRYERKLYGFLAKWLRNGADAEEAFQEIWLRVFESRLRYEPKAKFSTWLFRIATNHCIDRSRKFRPTVATAEERTDFEEEGVTHVVEDPRQSPQLAAERGELSAALRGAVDALPEGQKQVFLLAEGEGMDYREVGEILGIPVGTVKSRMHHACATLQVALAGHRG